MGFAPTWLRQVSPPLLHKTTLTTAVGATVPGIFLLLHCLKTKYCLSAFRPEEVMIVNTV